MAPPSPSYRLLAAGGYRLFLILVLVSCLGCRQAPEPQGPKFGPAPKTSGLPVYHLAVHPLHNPMKLAQDYQPLVDYLNGRLPGMAIELEASRDYADFEAKYRAAKPEFLLPNPWQTLQAMEVGYHVIAMAGEPTDFKGIFLVRRDGPVKRPEDLKGKVLSYPSPTALAACIMPQYFLHRHGLDVMRDIEHRYVGSQESAIMNAYLGLSAAGVTWPPPWRAFQKEHPQEAAALTLIWETEPLVNNSVMVRNDLAAPLGEQVRDLLVGLEQSPEGRAVLTGMETARFLPATDASYEVVRRYISRFESEVRPVESKP